MVSDKSETEALKILEVIDKYFPKIFEAKESIRWLHKHTTQGKQSEWAAIFFEEYSRPLLTNFLGGWHGIRITKSSRIDYQRYYNWDLKVHSTYNPQGKSQSTIILNDKATMDRIIRQESGIGFIVIDVDFSFDVSKKLQKWRDGFEGRARSHSSNSRIMKNKGNVKGLKAIFIKDEKTLKLGIKDGWISIFKQGRQLNGSARNPKYMMDLNDVPTNFVFTIN